MGLLEGEPGFDLQIAVDSEAEDETATGTTVADGTATDGGEHTTDVGNETTTNGGGTTTDGH